MGPASYSTRSLPASQQLRRWNDWASQNWTGLTVNSRGHGFPADLRTFDIGRTRISLVASEASIVRRKPLDQFGGRMILHAQMSGSTRNQQSQRQVELARGALALLRLDQGYELETSPDTRLLVAEFDEQALRERVGAAAIRGGIAIAPSAPGAAMVLSLLHSMCHSPNLPDDPRAGAMMERILLDSIALAVLSEDTAIVGRGHGSLFRRAVAAIEDHNGDCGFDVSTLAHELGVSQRALQMAFAQAGTTPSAYLLEHRLQSAAQRLASSKGKVTDVALDCGFSSSAHFSRSFSKRFGVSPRHYGRGGVD